MNEVFHYLKFWGFINELGKICFLLKKMNFWADHELERAWIKMLTIWCITQAGNMSNENTATASLHSKQWFQVKFAKFLWTLFYRIPPVAAFVFCKDFVDISYKNSHTHTRRLNVAVAYLLIKYNFILVCGLFFSDWWDTHIFFSCVRIWARPAAKIDGTLILTTSECYRIYLFSLPLKSAIMENSWYFIN